MTPHKQAEKTLTQNARSKSLSITLVILSLNLRNALFHPCAKRESVA